MHGVVNFLAVAFSVGAECFPGENMFVVVSDGGGLLAAEPPEAAEPVERKGEGVFRGGDDEVLTTYKKSIRSGFLILALPNVT